MGFPKLLIEEKPKKNWRITDKYDKKTELWIENEYCYCKSKSAYKNCNIIAEFVAGQLKNRVFFLKAMKQALQIFFQVVN